MGAAICFEHAFPQIFTILALQGAEVVFIPSAVPVGYEYLLNLRSRARAQDNQLFVVAVNRVGREGGVTYCGLSKVVNPRGEVIAEASRADEELLVAELNLDLILKERKQEPVLRSLRPELYRPLVELLGDKPMSSVLIVPEKDEGQRPLRVIEEGLKAETVDEVLVVDGWSTDDTVPLLSEKLLGLRRKHGKVVELIHSELRNTGKGGAMITGIKRALADGHDRIIFLDADITSMTSKW